MSGDEFHSFDTHMRDIWSYDKEKNNVERNLEIPAKFIQSVYPEERKSDFDTSYEIWEHSAKRPEKGKRPKTPSSSIS